MNNAGTIADGYWLDTEADAVEAMESGILNDLPEAQSSVPAESEQSEQGPIGAGISREDFLEALKYLAEQFPKAIAALKLPAPQVSITPEVVAHVVERREVRNVKRDPQGRIESVETKIISDE